MVVQFEYVCTVYEFVIASYSCFEIQCDRLVRSFGFGDIYRGGFLTFKSLFHKALDLFWFDCEFTFESVPGTKQY